MDAQQPTAENPFANSAKCMRCKGTIHHECYMIIAGPVEADVGLTICPACATMMAGDGCRVSMNHSFMAALVEFRTRQRAAEIARKRLGY